VLRLACDLGALVRAVTDAFAAAGLQGEVQETGVPFPGAS